MLAWVFLRRSESIRVLQAARRFNQNSPDVPKTRPERSAVPPVTARRTTRILVMRLTGTSIRLHSSAALAPSTPRARPEHAQVLAKLFARISGFARHVVLLLIGGRRFPHWPGGAARTGSPRRAPKAAPRRRQFLGHHLTTFSGRGGASVAAPGWKMGEFTTSGMPMLPGRWLWARASR